jgi:CRISPR-associated protein (TIGR03986 family)
VMISRRLHQNSPADLLDPSLKPAKLLSQLSPADRVFGWVGDGVKKNGNYRGQVRFGSVVCQTADAIQDFDNLPLNILGQPKQQQGRFYVSENYNTGKSQIEKRNNEDAGYKHGRGLRGRKVYPHHANWTIQNNLKEYQRPDRIQDSQNRSIEGWITPQTEFEFDIHFTNLSEVELGGLVWLLSLNGEDENKFFHRFGGGKPYGFGSVKLEIIESDVRDGKDLEKFYMSLDDEKIGKLEENTIKTLADEFKKLANSMFPTIIESFLRACEGFSDNKPTHYPRKSKNLTADTKSFEWFVENNRIDRGTVKNGYVLQDLADDEGLPYL